MKSRGKAEYCHSCLFQWIQLITGFWTYCIVANRGAVRQSNGLEIHNLEIRLILPVFNPLLPRWNVHGHILGSVQFKVLVLFGFVRCGRVPSSKIWDIPMPSQDKSNSFVIHTQNKSISFVIPSQSSSLLLKTKHFLSFSQLKTISIVPDLTYNVRSRSFEIYNVYKTLLRT